MGQGPKTGRGAGFCSGYQVPGYANGAVYGYGGGFGRGYGRGAGAGHRGAWGAGRGFFRNGWAFGFDSVPVNERDALLTQSEYLEKELQAIKLRLEALDSNAKTE